MPVLCRFNLYGIFHFLNFLQVLQALVSDFYIQSRQAEVSRFLFICFGAAANKTKQH
jgi:hypothetical protein